MKIITIKPKLILTVAVTWMIRHIRKSSTIIRTRDKKAITQQIQTQAPTVKAHEICT